MSRPRTILYIGAPKTGSSYIQQRLSASRARLAQHGWLYPGPSQHHTNAFVALLGKDAPFGSDIARENPRRFWSPLAQRLAKHRGHLLLSTELMSCADSAQIDLMLRAIGRRNLEVVITARALDRVLPSAWQQAIKYGAIETADEYYRNLADARTPPYGRSRWLCFDYAKLIDRWRAHPAIAEVRLVITPRRRDDACLWQRWLDATELPLVAQDGFYADAKASNPSLNVDQVRFLRHFNLRTLGPGKAGDSRQSKLLAGIVTQMKQGQHHRGADKVELHSQYWREHVARWSTNDCEALAQSSIRSFGDIAELRVDPNGPQNETRDPGSASAEEQRLLDTAVQALLTTETTSKSLATKLSTHLRRHVAYRWARLRGIA